MATVALVGAKGNLGYMFLPELVESSAIKKIHCISRRAEKSGDPKVEWFQVDYEKPESVEKALKGCEVLINLMGTQGAYEKNKHTLVDMAAKAGVKFYIPRYRTSDVC
jgi:NAD(P)H dehydrogenase (quinone)